MSEARKSLSDCRSAPDAEIALAHLLRSQTAVKLSSTQVTALAEVLASPVASAIYQRGDEGRKWGSLDARRSIASRLGLGDLT